MVSCHQKGSAVTVVGGEQKGEPLVSLAVMICNVAGKREKKEETGEVEGTLHGWMNGMDG